MWVKIFIQNEVFEENPLTLIIWKRGFKKVKYEVPIKIDTLEMNTKKFNLNGKVLKILILKLSKEQENLDKLWGSRRISFKKERIAYNPFNKKVYMNFFVQLTSQAKSHGICNYYQKNGHIS